MSRTIPTTPTTTTACFAACFPRLLVVNYYDDYRFLNLLDVSTRTSLAYAALSGYDARHLSACGQLTGTRSYVADAGGQYIASAIYYDAKGRPVQQHTTTLRGGYERSWLQYRFAGGVQRLRRHHYDPSGGNLVSSYRYAYDSCERLTAVYHTLGDGQEVCLSTLSYDAYGRLGRRTLHGGIHSSTYSYNIRDWLTGISGPKFTQHLYYNTGSGTPCWNGNISSMTWQAGSETTLCGYKFAYDGLNRLTSATYGEGTSLTASPNRYTEKVTSYDKNGNIKGLQRYGQTAASTYGLIDNLTLSYDGNRLTRADDAVTASAYGGGFEFKDGVKQANEYTYDANGNLTKDLNKNISSIQYNSLNLPSIVTFGDGSTITYTYTADGTKLRTVHQIGGTTTTTDYCGDVIYENGVQKLLLTEAGYITLTDNQYHYYLQDHQGNNRVVLNQSGAVEEVNHYYPFGGVFASTGNVQPYKYNGKELDAKKGLNWYDYGARHYDAALGRFLTVDPMAENMHSANQYTYCLNNPLNYIDPLGADTIDVKNVDWSNFNVDQDVIALDEVNAVSFALSKAPSQVFEPINGFWGYVGYYLLDIGASYYDSQTRLNYRVGTDGRVKGISPMMGIPPLPSMVKTSGISVLKGLWKLTQRGSSKIIRHPMRGVFYKSKSDGLWWVKDQAEHGGSYYKVYTETSTGIKWYKDADKYGNFIENKHKSNVGTFISWKEFIK